MEAGAAATAVNSSLGAGASGFPSVQRTEVLDSQDSMVDMLAADPVEVITVPDTQGEGAWPPLLVAEGGMLPFIVV